MTVMFAVNNMHGMFTGHVEAIHFSDHTDTLLELQYSGKTRCRFSESRNEIKISHRKFTVQSYREWVGNWCWNGGMVDTETASEMANYLLSTGKWDIEAGLTQIWDEWEAGKKIDFGSQQQK